MKGKWSNHDEIRLQDRWHENNSFWRFLAFCRGAKIVLVKGRRYKRKKATGLERMVEGRRMGMAFVVAAHANAQETQRRTHTSPDSDTVRSVLLFLHTHAKSKGLHHTRTLKGPPPKQSNHHICSYYSYAKACIYFFSSFFFLPSFYIYLYHKAHRWMRIFSLLFLYRESRKKERDHRHRHTHDIYDDTYYTTH